MFLREFWLESHFLIAGDTILGRKAARFQGWLVLNQASGSLRVPPLPPAFSSHLCVWREYDMCVILKQILRRMKLNGNQSTL
jgi:hypothetical protein